jgi:O-antigen ligase
MMQSIRIEPGRVSSPLAEAIRIGLVVLLWMPLVFTQNETIFAAVDGKSLFARSLIELLAAAWVILVVIDPAYRPRRSWVVLAFGAYVLASLLSALFGVSITRSIWSEFGRMVGVWDLFHWFALVVIASSVLRTPAQWRLILTWMLVISLILSVVALAQGYGFWLPFFPNSVLEARERTDATLGNASFLAAILVVTTLLALGFLARSFLRRDPEEGEAQAPPVRGRGRRPTRQQEERHLEDFERKQRRYLQLRRLFWAAVVLLGAWAMLLTGTRGAFVGLLAGLIAMPAALGIWGNRKALRPVAALSGGILLSLIVIFVVVEAADTGIGGRNVFTRLRSGSESSLDFRLSSGKIGLQAFADRPILGWGPENYSVAFNKYVDADFSKFSIANVTEGHISVVDQLVTRGIVGGLLFLAMWGVVFWRLVRRRRPPREEVIAYAVLGGLVGYFVQNLALFDSPATILIWAVLFAWVSAQDHKEEPPPKARTSRPTQSTRGLGQGVLGSPWGLGGLVLLVIVLLGFTLTVTNQRAYSSTGAFRDGWFAPEWTESLDHFQDAFDAFPGMANMLRQMFFQVVEFDWEALTPAEKTRTLEMLEVELEKGLKAEPRSTILLLTAIILKQTAAATPEEIERIDPLLERLKELAPDRLQTHERQAIQELSKGNPQKAIDIIDRFIAQVPEANFHFIETRELVEQRLGAERG